MKNSLEFLNSLNERELAFFYTFRLPTLEKQQQLEITEVILSKISEKEIQIEIGRPPMPTINKCRRCNSDKVEFLTEGVNIDGPRTCTICLKVHSKSLLLRGLYFLFDFFTQGNG